MKQNTSYENNRNYIDNIIFFFMLFKNPLLYSVLLKHPSLGNPMTFQIPVGINISFRNFSGDFSRYKKRPMGILNFDKNFSLNLFLRLSCGRHIYWGFPFSWWGLILLIFYHRGNLFLLFFSVGRGSHQVCETGVCWITKNLRIWHKNQKY